MENSSDAFGRPFGPSTQGRIGLPEAGDPPRVTPRMLLKKLATEPPATQTPSSSPLSVSASLGVSASSSKTTTSRPRHTTWPYEPISLETSLSKDEQDEVSRHLASRVPRRSLVLFKTCPVCKLPKVYRARSSVLEVVLRPPQAVVLRVLRRDGSVVDDSSAVDSFTEFGDATTCCHQIMCNVCYTQALLENVVTGWWSNIGSRWVRCPSRACSKVLPLGGDMDLGQLLRKLRYPDISFGEAVFRRAEALRESLSKLGPMPTNVLARAATLHSQLIEHGWMFDHVKHGLNMRPGFPAPETVKLLSFAAADGSGITRLPVFIGWVKHPLQVSDAEEPRTKRRCAVCLESFIDLVPGKEKRPQAALPGDPAYLTIGDEASFEEAATGFPGDWHLYWRHFPPRAWLPECAAEHDLVVCRACLSTHIAVALSGKDADVVTAIICPTRLVSGCTRNFTRSQFEQLAGPEDKAKSDSLLFDSDLSALPGFQWCPRCTAGLAYDGTDGNGCKITCGKCGCETCFDCRMLWQWHKGMTCKNARAAKAAFG